MNKPSLKSIYKLWEKHFLEFVVAGSVFSYALEFQIGKKPRLKFSFFTIISNSQDIYKLQITQLK